MYIFITAKNSEVFERDNINFSLFFDVIIRVDITKFVLCFELFI